MRHAPREMADGLHLLRLAQLQFHLLERRDVRLDAHEMRDLAVFDDRRNAEGVPKRRSVLAIVQDLHEAGPAIAYGIPDPIPCLRRCLDALKEPAIATEDFVVPIAGQRGETFIRINDWIAGLIRVRNRDALKKGVKSLDLELVRFLQHATFQQFTGKFCVDPNVFVEPVVSVNPGTQCCLLEPPEHAVAH